MWPVWCLHEMLCKRIAACGLLSQLFYFIYSNYCKHYEAKTVYENAFINGTKETTTLKKRTGTSMLYVVCCIDAKVQNHAYLHYLS